MIGDKLRKPLGYATITLGILIALFCVCSLPESFSRYTEIVQTRDSTYAATAIVTGIVLRILMIALSVACIVGGRRLKRSSTKQPSNASDRGKGCV